MQELMYEDAAIQRCKKSFVLLPPCLLAQRLSLSAHAPSVHVARKALLCVAVDFEVEPGH
eukprot:3925242-Rhodomonas_salina.2